MDLSGFNKVTPDGCWISHGNARLSRSHKSVPVNKKCFLVAGKATRVLLTLGTTSQPVAMMVSDVVEGESNEECILVEAPDDNFLRSSRLRGTNSSNCVGVNLGFLTLPWIIQRCSGKSWGSWWGNFFRCSQMKVSRTLQVVIYLNLKVLLVYKLFALLLAHLDVYAPITYVQDDILNPT